ncbi:uncharacterized protein LOC126315922 [Schistocerca gregaria]|uniref:uncharacterized protein LOC126315922 n=1 Tax=Schistocerca gregaria TaxID=7010 RepID=UPI00211DF038|nr:uncharacterized protein LOC126315922 [Schistocerca gregaria]
MFKIHVLATFTTACWCHQGTPGGVNGQCTLTPLSPLADLVDMALRLLSPSSPQDTPSGLDVCPGSSFLEDVPVACNPDSGVQLALCCPPVTFCGSSLHSVSRIATIARLLILSARGLLLMSLYHKTWTLIKISKYFKFM